MITYKIVKNNKQSNNTFMIDVTLRPCKKPQRDVSDQYSWWCKLEKVFKLKDQN